MKQINHILTMLLLLLSLSASAYDFESDGIYYNITSSSELTVEVTFGGYRYSSITIPSSVTDKGKTYSVTSIGEKAFPNCYSLKSVNIPSSVTSIGDNAFKYCSSLASINIPSSVTSIGDYAFYGCSSLASINIPSSVTSIGDYAFYNCNSLQSVTIGEGVLSIGYSAFPSGINKIIWLTNTPPKGFTYVNGNCNYVSNDSYNSILHGLKGLTVYPYLSSIFEVDGIKYVPVSPSERTCDAIDCAYNNTAAEINIGNTVSYKGIAMTIKDVKPYTCYKNDSVKKITIDFSGDIVNNTFSYCSSLETLNIKANTIGTSAFEGSATKNDATFIIHANSIASSAFKGCSAIINADIQTKTIGYNAFGASATKNDAAFIIHANKIAGSAFKGCSAIINADIQTDTIGTSAFEASATKNDATFIIHANGIAGSAFKGCSAIINADIQTNTIGESAFEASATKSQATFAIKAKKIDKNAFKSCSSLQSVTLGEELTQIGDSAFFYCRKLDSITIPSAVTSIGSYCFSYCSSLKYANIGTGITSIPNYTFYGCKSLPKINVPKTVKSIGNYVFGECSSLADVTIDDRDTELTLGSNGYSPLFAACPLNRVYIGGNISYPTSGSGYSPFYRNTSLETVIITDKETEISENEFYGCTNLQNVVIGDGIETIGKWAFSGCAALDNFAFGTSLRTIGTEAFSDCTAMTKIVSKTATPPTCGSQALDDINKWTCELFVPQESMDKYKAANQWKEFFFIQADGIDGVVYDKDYSVKDLIGKVSVYNVAGRLVKTVEGVNSANGIMSGLKAGTYVVKCGDETVKVMKE